MSAEANPFKERPPKSGRVGDWQTAKRAWTVAGILGGLLIIVSLFWAGAVGKLRTLQGAQTTADDATADDATARLAAATAENQKEKDEIALLQSQVAQLEKEKEATAQMAKGLENEMRSDLESKDVTISNLQGKLTVNILDRVLFASGEAVLQPEGEAVLKKIAAFLGGHPNLKIQVIGNTDNVPIRNRFASNWELSTARALAAVHFLTERAGVDPHRVGASGFGEYRPIADNGTAEGRARNRRIAITILPDELAAADAATNAKPAITKDPAPSAKVPEAPGDEIIKR